MNASEHARAHQMAVDAISTVWKDVNPARVPFDVRTAMFILQNLAFAYGRIAEEQKSQDTLTKINEGGGS